MSTPAPAPAAPPKETDPVDLLEVRRACGVSCHPGPSVPTSLFYWLVCTCIPAALVCSQEDDEFEEFEQQEWTGATEDAEDPAMWADGWEHDEDDDQFTAQLRAELVASEKGQTSMQQ